MTVCVLSFVVLVDILAGALFNPVDVVIPNPYYHHDFRKNDAATLPWGPRRYLFRTNSLGFRDKSHRDIALTTDKRRILFIGDSFTEGVGLPYDETFVGMIEAALDPGRFEILNAAVSSYTPKFYFLKTKHLLESVGLKFDELFVYVDISDVQDEVLYARLAATTPEEVWPRYVDSVLKQHSFMYPNFLRESLLGAYYYVAHLGDDDRITRSALLEQYFETLGLWTESEHAWRVEGVGGTALAQDYMDKLHRLCREHGIKMSIAVYPWPRQIEAQRLESKQVVIWRGFARERGLDFLDYFPVFIGSDAPHTSVEKYFIPGDAHWNAAGHQKIADEWLRFYNGPPLKNDRGWNE